MSDVIEIAGLRIKDAEARKDLKKIKENISNFKKYFFGVFFHRTTLEMEYFTSLDGINWGKQDVFNDLKGRDPSLIYVKDIGKFILTYSSASATNTFNIGVSSDLINWEWHNVLIEGYTSERNCWAPDLMYKDGRLYVTFTVKNIDNDNLKVYLTYTNDLINFNNWETPYNLDLGLDYVIDSQIKYIDNTYYLVCKNGDNSNIVNPIQIYSSTDLINWELYNDSVINAQVEGVNLIPYENNFLINVDMFLEWGQAFCKTNDLTNTINWNESNNLTDYAHGSILYVEDEEADSIIKKLGINFAGNNNDKPNINALNITGTYENFVVLPGYVYTITGNPTITNLLNPFNLDLVSMKFATNITNKLTIVNIGNNLKDMKKRDLVLSNSAGINEQTFLLDLRWGYNSSTLPIVKTINVKDYWQNASGLEINSASVTMHGTSGLLSLSIKATSNFNNSWVHLLALPDNTVRAIAGGLICGDRKNIYQMNANNVYGAINLSAGVTEVVRIPFVC